jgi:hypothetical protein
MVTYAQEAKTVHVTMRVESTETGIRIHLDADQPAISSVDMGSWAMSLNASGIAVPYYSGDIWYSKDLAEYLNGWWDWHTTHSTKLTGTEAIYQPKTDGSLNNLHEQLEVVLSATVDAVFPEPENLPSPYMATLSGRTVLDIWDTNFPAIEHGLFELGDYGIEDCVAIIHNWQHYGYDNALPSHYPANPKLGGDAGLRAAIAQGKANGCLVALHENYVDYYPNFPTFDAAAVALNGDGSRMLAWLNKGTGIQSFATKPNWMLRNARAQSPVIHALYGTTAGFVDVNSSVVPSWHGDMDARSPQAGMLSAFVQNSQALWAYERTTHGGPVLGEGTNHWYYSGLLDGVEAQLGAGSVRSNMGEIVPLFVDFDLLRIHPLQVNHGMGYYSRWTTDKNGLQTTAQADAYRMQEIAFGHAPFLSTGAWNSVPRALVESNLVEPVATAYGTARVRSIHYRRNGEWETPSTAAQSTQFTQVKVAYDNGLTLVANASAEPLTWEGLSIPQYGWAATSADLLAYTALCGRTICDFVQTPTSLFANARNQLDQEAYSGFAAPSVDSVKQVSANSFSICYRWRVLRSPGAQHDLRAFVHFVDDHQVSSPKAGILFQGDFYPVPATSRWQAGQTVVNGPISVTVPPSVRDGTYSIRIGLYDPITGKRLPLSGISDGNNRYIVGSLIINGARTQVTSKAPTTTGGDPRVNTLGTLVNFGPVQTDGMISMKRVDGQWILRPYPRSRNFTVLLNSKVFPAPTVVEAVGTTISTSAPVVKGVYWQVLLNGSKSYTWPHQ